MLTQRKARLVIIAAIALLAMSGLALGLSQVQFKPGVQVNLGNSTPSTGSYSTIIDGNFLESIVKAIYGMALVACAIYLIYMLIDKERRKLLGKTLLRMIPLLALAYFASQYVRACTRTGAETATQPVTAGQVTPGAGLPSPTFSPNISQGLILAASLLLALMAAILVTVIIIRMRQANQRQTTPLLRLADQAQAALDALDAGGDLKNAVLRCYYEMNRILLAEKGMIRDKAMTPREFEAQLAEKGLPDEPIQHLTRLFEAVRYGADEPSAPQENVARASLSAIIQACRSIS